MGTDTYTVLPTVAQEAVDTLHPIEATDYDTIKTTILSTFNILKETYTRHLREVE